MPFHAPRITKWPDGKQAAFVMAFDDSAPTARRHVIPELAKRGMTGVFYPIPAGPTYQGQLGSWRSPLPGIEYGNHTFSHGATTDAAQMEMELRTANEEIALCFPGRKWPRLISFCAPGGRPWLVGAEETEAALKRHHLVRRPRYKGYPDQLPTLEAILALPDAALASGGLEYVNFHGVGGDWLSIPLEWFIALLDKLESVRDRIWITDFISAHQYETEREAARLHVTGPDSIRLEISTDPAFYDIPLTLEIDVPEEGSWMMTQGEEQLLDVAGGPVLCVPVMPISGELIFRKR